MKKHLAFLTLGMLMLHSVRGQQVDSKMLPSNGGGLNSSMGNLASPNLFDGSTTVSIPIHAYGDFGISLSYNTKGVQVEELSGQIGTHWNLNAGGRITRTVKDIPDDADESFDNDPYDNVNSPYSILGRARQYGLTSKPIRQYWDGENDEFMVSAGSLQFTFKLGKDGYVFTYPENRYKIVPIASSGSGGLMYDKFQITDNNGNKYTFGTHSGVRKGSINFGNTAIGVSGNLGWVEEFYYTAEWFLDEVAFANGQKISYTYMSVQYPVEDPPNEGLSLYRTASRAYPNPDPNDPNSGFLNAEAVWMGDLQQDTYVLQSIQYPDNTLVNFIFDQGAGFQPNCMKSIKQIEISQGGNCVKYRFNKAYLKRGSNYQLAEEVPFDQACNYDPATVGDGTRMILKSIDILNCDETESQPYYSFEYSNACPPPRWGNNRDYFGYCKAFIEQGGAGSLNNYIAQPTNGKGPFDASTGEDPCNRETTDDVNVMAALSLTKVKNAYGGSLSFQYELHSGLVAITNGMPGMPDPAAPYASHLFKGKNASDGLRLYRTIAEDKYRPGNKLINTYTYEDGKIFLNGGYYAYPTIMNTSGEIKQYIGTANWVSAHQFINGSNHGYSKVTVTTTTENTGTLLSKTIHYFSNFNSIATDYVLNGPSGQTKDYFQLPYTDKQYIKDWKIGLPLQIETFDRNGKIISRTTNTYDTESENDYTSALDGLGLNTHRMRVSKVSASGTTGLNPENNIVSDYYNIATDNYIPFRGKALLTSTQTQKFINDNTAITDNVEYTYDSYTNLKNITTHNSKGESFMTRNVYNYNVSGPNVTAGNQTGTDLYNMTDAGIEQVVSTERWKLDPAGSSHPSINDQLMDASITKYTYSDNKVKTQKLFMVQGLDPVSYSSYRGIDANPYSKVLAAYNTTQCPAGFKEVSEVLQYDTKGNPIETQLGGQDSYKSMIWDLPTGNKLAEANCKLNEMAFSGFESENKGNWVYNQTNVIVPSGNVGTIDGSHILRANSGDSGPFLSVSNLTPNKEYTLTFWSKVGAIHITGGGITSGDIPYALLYGDYSPGNSGWRYYQARFTPVNSSPIEFNLTATGSPFTVYLDDVRLFPTGATMNCWNYESLWGPSSSVDPSGRIIYYEYDPFGRLYITRNQEGNIIAKKDTHISQ